MVISINALAEPVGSMKSWLRPDATVPLPSGWLVCDGTTVVDASSSFDGKAIPDLRGRFPRGHSTLTNASFPADMAYFAGGTIPSGGVDSIALSHSHSVPNHSHNVNSHSHGVNLGSHTHTLPGTTSFQATVTAGLGAPGGVIGPGPGPTGHNHLMTTTSGGTVASGTSDSTGGTTDSGGSGTNSSLGTPTTTPPFNDFVTIIKIK